MSPNAQTYAQQKTKKEKPTAIIPIPADTADALQEVVKSKYNIKNHGKAVSIHVYKNIKNESVFCICRYEKDGGKEHIPYYYSTAGWRAGRPPGLKK